jgi:hypothetical protein
MSKGFKTILLAPVPVVMVMLLLCGCQKQAEIDFGTVNNSVYQNKYFGLSMTFPQDWSIQNLDEQRRLEAAGGQALYGDDPNKKAVLIASELRIVNMFAVFKHAVGSPVPSNPNLISMAENVRGFPEVKTGADYLNHVKQQLASGQLEVSFPKDVYDGQLGGKDFAVLEAFMTVGGKTVRQKFYSSVMKGYALCFILSFNTDDEEASLQKILDTTTFKQASRTD